MYAIFTKSKQRILEENHLPISLFPVFDNILEKVIFDSLHDYLRRGVVVKGVEHI